LPHAIVEAGKSEFCKAAGRMEIREELLMQIKSEISLQAEFPLPWIPQFALKAFN
jgi:hypothetical protein